MYRFAPYAIHLKKITPSYKIIVYTRRSRFDLYGKYASVLVPLALKHDNKFTQSKFGLNRFPQKNYETLVKYFYDKYKNRFDIIEHFYPDISKWRYKIKWQLPRSKMDYDFEVRNENLKIIEGLFDSTSNVFVTKKDSDIRHMLLDRNYNPVMNHWLYDLKKWNNNISFVGCVIACLKDCKFVVGNVESWLTKLALLLKIPVISINEEMSYDSIHLLNPFNTPVINCRNIEEGINIYENYF